MRPISFLPPPAIVVQADRFDLYRCRCPECLRLDATHPREGWQLAFWPYTARSMGRGR